MLTVSGAVRCVLIIALVAVLAGCASGGPTRNSSQVCEADPEACRSYSIERTNDYLLGVVEFDNQGSLQNPEQLDALLQQMATEATVRDLSVLVFVHGWKHNASPDDSDVKNFRVLLQALNYTEQARPVESWRKRRVVGIYVGWPGSSLEIPIAKNLTFWTRKAAAHRVAEGSIRELFARTRHFIERYNFEDLNGCKRSMRLVFVGHSFGAIIVYSSIAQHLVEIAAVGSAQEDGTISGYGDLVVLINPAFEGNRYESINRIIQKSQFAMDQKPVLISVTSEADWATKYAFPVGRWISTFLSRTNSDEQSQAVRHAVGHIDRYQTHYLSLGQPHPRLPRSFNVSEKGKLFREEVERNALDTFNASNRDERGVLRNHWERTYSAGAILRHVSKSPTNPFWIISASPEVVPSHNGIWKYEFLDFFRQLYRDLVRPLEESCGGGASNADRR